MRLNHAITSARPPLASLRAMAVSILVAGLVACGGDGGTTTSTAPTDMGSTAPAGITQANATSVTRASLQNSQSLTGLTTHIAQILAAATTGTTCAAGGTYTVAVTGPTSATITLTDCRQVANGSVYNGTVSVTNVVRSGNSASGTASLDVTITQTGVSSSITIVGSFNLDVATNGPTTNITLTGSNVQVTVGANSYSFTNFSLSSSLNGGVYTNNISFTASSTAIGGSVTVTTVTPFLKNAANLYPHSGVAHIAGNMSALHVTVLGNETVANDREVQIEVDANGDGTYESGSTITTSWAALAAM